MAVDEASSNQYAFSNDWIQEEAENILESYREGESYSTEIESTGLEPGEVEDGIADAVDHLNMGSDYTFHDKLLMGSGGAASSAGAFAIMAGEPLGLAPVLVGGGHFLAANYRKSSKDNEVETKALLQDALYRNLEVEEENGRYSIEFDYSE